MFVKSREFEWTKVVSVEWRWPYFCKVCIVINTITKIHRISKWTISRKKKNKQKTTNYTKLTYIPSASSFLFFCPQCPVTFFPSRGQRSMKDWYKTSNLLFHHPCNTMTQTGYNVYLTTSVNTKNKGLFKNMCYFTPGNILPQMNRQNLKTDLLRHHSLSSFLVSRFRF